jgi:molybdopterin synthase catalytic subunit
MHIEIRKKDFVIGDEYDALIRDSHNAGAQVIFIGRVRDFDEEGTIKSLSLSHYPGMTETVIEDICKRACERWNIQQIRVIHRVGELQGNEQIVLVGVSSEHRTEAFSGAEFIMDALKTEATFWKKEKRIDGRERWLDMKSDDLKRAAHWDKGGGE